MSQFAHPRGCVLWFNLATLEGARVYDQSDYDNHGTIYGARWLRGPIGGRLSFDGIDDYVEVPTAPSLENYPNGMSVFAFIKPAKDHTAWNRIVDTRYAGEFYFGFQAGVVNALSVFINAVNVLNTGANAVKKDVWSHVGFTYDRSKVRIYVDGKEAVAPADFTEEPISTAYPIRIACATHGVVYLFTGDVALVRIHNRALSPDEIKAHHYYCLTRLKEG